MVIPNKYPEGIPSGYHREKKPNDVKHIYASENKMRVSFSEMPLEFFCSLCAHNVHIH
jgi:hypothetical protein